MVARLPLTLRVEPMTIADIAAVHDIERASFPVPWPAVCLPPGARDQPARALPGGPRRRRTVAYGGIWLMVDEAHVTTFAVLPAWRRQGVGAA